MSDSYAGCPSPFSTYSINNCVLSADSITNAYTCCQQFAATYVVCEQNMAYMRGLVVYSNFAFIFPPLILFIVRCLYKQFAVRPADLIFCLAQFAVLITSSLYHQCENADNSIVCGGQHCLLDENSHYVLDLIASGWLVHATLMIDWYTTQSKWHAYIETYKAVISYGLPFGAIIFDFGGNYNYFYYIASIAAMDIVLRTMVKNKYMRDTECCHRHCRCLRMCFHDAEHVFPLSSIYAWIIWLPLTLFFIVFAIVIKYDSTQMSGTFVDQHTSWHVLCAAASVCGMFTLIQLPQRAVTHRTTANGGPEYALLSKSEQSMST